MEGYTKEEILAAFTAWIKDTEGTDKPAETDPDKATEYLINYMEEARKEAETI